MWPLPGAAGVECISTGQRRQNLVGDPLLDLPEKATLSDLTDDREGVDPSVLASYFADFNAYLELDCLEDEDLEDLVQIHSIFAAHRRSNKIKAQYRRVDRQEHVFTLLHVGKFEQRF